MTSEPEGDEVLGHVGVPWGTLVYERDVRFMTAHTISSEGG